MNSTLQDAVLEMRSSGRYLPAMLPPGSFIRKRQLYQKYRRLLVWIRALKPFLTSFSPLGLRTKNLP